MSTKFQDLVTKKKGELQDIADENDIDYSTSTDRASLIERICNPTSKQKYLLTLRADGVKNQAEEYGVEYTTKKETQSKIAQKLEESENSGSSKEKSSSDKITWKGEFKKALQIATTNMLREKRSYKIVETDEENTFNVCPSYMRHDEDYKLLVTITISEYAKKML